nr:MAG TPA: hypothetical protein [Microviridae sp.]
MKKKYLPVTYVDENGVIWTKEQLTNKICLEEIKHEEKVPTSNLRR